MDGKISLATKMDAAGYVINFFKAAVFAGKYSHYVLKLVKLIIIEYLDPLFMDNLGICEERCEHLLETCPTE